MAKKARKTLFGEYIKRSKGHKYPCGCGYGIPEVEAKAGYKVCEFCDLKGKKRAGVDMINRPSHYTKGGIETIDFIEAKGLGYLDGNVVKYISRYRFKGKPVEDLKKACWYIDRLIKQEEKNRRTP